MKFVLLGIDVDSLGLALALAASDEHSLSGYFLDVDSAEELESLRPLIEKLEQAVPTTHRWDTFRGIEDLREVDALIVARGSDVSTRLELLRPLLREEAIPLVISHPQSSSALDYYQLELYAGDSTTRLIPLLVDRWAPQVQELVEVVRASQANPESSSPYGRIEQVLFERSMTDRNRQDVVEQFARDADLLSVLCGEITRVAAMGPAADSQGYGNLGVQMSADSGILARWSIEPAQKTPAGRLTVIGSTASVTLDLPLTTDAQLVEGVVSAVANKPSPNKISPTRPTWQQATRSLEITEALEKSLRKGRTIKLRYDGRGEEDAFKGTMASLGCALLLGGTGLIFVLAVVLYFVGRSKLPWLQNFAGILGYWPHALLTLMIVFLLMQLLRFVIPSSTDDDASGPSNGNDSSSS